MQGDVDLVGAADAAELAPAIARGVDEARAASSPDARPEAITESVVDHVCQPGCGQGPHPRGEFVANRRIVQVHRQAIAVADEPGSASGCDKHRIGHNRLVGSCLGREDGTNAACPRSQRARLGGRRNWLVHVVVSQHLAQSGRIQYRIISQPAGDSRTR